MKVVMKFLRLPVACIALLLSSCVMNTTQPTSFAYEILKPGASLVLLQSIRFPGYSAAVTIQYGELRTGFRLDQYYPNCRLELRSQSPNPRIIEPDRFTIYKVHTNIEYVMNKPVMTAGFGLHLADGTSDQIYSTILYLKSEKQPEVELLSCQRWEDPTNFPEHLSVDQIKQTLDGFFTLEN